MDGMEVAEAEVVEAEATGKEDREAADEAKEAVDEVEALHRKPARAVRPPLQARATPAEWWATSGDAVPVRVLLWLRRRACIPQHVNRATKDTRAKYCLCSQEESGYW